MNESESVSAGSTGDTASSAPPTVDSIFESVTAELSAEPSPTTETPAPAPTAAPTIPAPGTEAPIVETAGQTPPGEPPPERWPTILENARTKTRDEVTREFQQKHADALKLGEALQANPAGALTGILDEALEHPDLGPVLMSHFARKLGSRRGSRAQAPVETPEPQADLQLQDGTLVYSAARQAEREAWLSQRMLAQVRQEFGQQMAPAMELSRSYQQIKQQRQQVETAIKQYTPYVEELREMPGFTEHQSAIVKRQSELFDAAAKAGSPVDPMRLLMRAYREIVPAQQQQQQQQAVAQSQQSLVEQAAAKLRASSANPAASVPTQPRKIDIRGRSQAAVLDDIWDAALAEAR